MTSPRSTVLTLALIAACGCLAASHVAAQTAPYNLGALPDGFVAHWPTPPTITRQVQVTTSSAFNQAAAVAGTRVVVAAVITSGARITASDVEVIMNPGASLGSLTIDHATKRIALRGGTYTGQIETAVAASWTPNEVDNPAWIVEDVMIDGVTVRSTSSTLMLRGHRIAVLRCTGHAAEYSLYSDMINGQQNTDFVIAGNRFESEGVQATMRLIHARNAIVVDNRLTDLLQTGSKHNFRIHGTSSGVYAARNMLVNAGMMLGTMSSDALNDIWIRSNVLFHNTPDLFNPDRTRIHGLHATYNTAYTDVWSCFYCGPVPADWQIGQNVVHPYRPAPP